MKKVLSFVLALAIMFSCVSVVGSVNALAATDFVSSTPMAANSGYSTFVERNA